MYKNKISTQNERSVMRQVLKLASGQGVRYESRKVRCCFVKNSKGLMGSHATSNSVYSMDGPKVVTS